MNFTILKHPTGEPLAQAVCDLLVDVFIGEGFSSSVAARGQFDAAILAERGTTWVARATESVRPIGTVFLVEPENRFRQIAIAGELEVHLMAVARSERRSSVASGLLRTCVDEARTRRAERLVLSSAPTMRAAHALYEKHGFVRRPSRDWTRPDGRMHWAYELELGTRQ